MSKQIKIGKGISLFKGEKILDKEWLIGEGDSIYYSQFVELKIKASSVDVLLKGELMGSIFSPEGMMMVAMIAKKSKIKESYKEITHEQLSNILIMLGGE